ncbi:ATPase-AAA-core domain-containing protein [Vairimorpha necatrix]|uniref:ATPase-AAA-core domain-containing protein n=1 Tax=Vairimorpha necatrix TaxID=6039 RepID=A0AAX4JGK0_9MICR
MHQDEISDDFDFSFSSLDCDFSNSMSSGLSTISKSKFLSFKRALENRHDNIIVVSGPSGCLKSTFINSVLKDLSLVPEYIEDVTLYKNKLLTKSKICLTDIDDLEYFIRNKSKINQMTNLIIETRLLPYMHKSLNKGLCITLSYCTKIQNFTGNFHSLPFSKFDFYQPSLSIYKVLNNLYGSRNRRISISYDKKILKYIFTNSLFHLRLDSLYFAYESISLADYQMEEFLDYAVYAVSSSYKNKTNKFVKIQSWAYEEHFVCTKLCTEFKKYST